MRYARPRPKAVLHFQTREELHQCTNTLCGEVFARNADSHPTYYFDAQVNRPHQERQADGKRAEVHKHGWSDPSKTAVHNPPHF